MPTSKDVDQTMLVRAVAAQLKEKMQEPEWALFVKTGVSRERPPQQRDWWWMRAASILRKVDEEGPVGVQRLRTYYGGRKRHTHSPAHFKKAGGKIIRTILADLEKQGMIAKTSKPRKGRVITPEGRKILNMAMKVKDSGSMV
ncbi:MAG: 30S ribosomal protein S19e [Candidatus Aenigmarchaeota archaeon]|nr:30S ribosomal protein S19e [Candidatus Aenigmarchaeota archaeon]